MRRVVKFTEADVARAIKAAQKANIRIACIRIEPDGTILIIPGAPENVAPSPEPNDWDCGHGKH